MNVTARREDIDVLKGFAIIAVILFHMYILKSGYLGVDLFFVISGYLIVPRLFDQFCQKDLIFNYYQFEKKRIIRLWPLIVIASIVCLIIGYIGMLPDDFENLTENIIASNLLSTNILSSITIKDYWAVRTSYQPLMHLWYVGILVEYYLLLPLILFVIRFCSTKCGLNIQKSIINTLSLLTVVSIILYLLPSESASTKFYLLPYRFFELTLGGIVAIKGNMVKRIIEKGPKNLYYFSLICLVLIILISLFSMKWGQIGLEEIPVGSNETIARSNVFLLPRQACLLLTVLFSVVVLVLGEKHGRSLNIKFLSHLGVMSFSLFIWHQIFLAFYRYYITADISWLFCISFFVVIYIISYITYTFVEKNFKKTLSQIIISLLAIICCCISFVIYNNAGVVRDIPELGYKKASVTRGMHKQYTDRIYKLSKPFKDNGKINVLLKGNSFARDFGSILMESNYRDSINIYLIKNYDNIKEDIIKKADFAFIFSNKEDVPDLIWDNIPHENIYGIGTKTYGDSNGIIYKNRHEPFYFAQTIKPRIEYLNLNEEWAGSWGDHYFNFMKMSMDSEQKVRVFTPDKMFISQDCRHFTQAGAQYFASMIDFDKIFSKRITK